MEGFVNESGLIQFAEAVRSLVSNVSLTPGADGREVEFRVGATHVQWRYAGDTTWINLIAIEDLRGDQGPPGETAISNQNPRGLWSPLETYNRSDNDVVISPNTGNQYAVLFDNVVGGEPPESNSNFVVTVFRGAPGPPGPKGINNLIISNIPIEEGDPLESGMLYIVIN